MSNLVNKVKEVFHSSQDTPSDERTGKLNLSAEERARLEAAGYGPEHHAEKRHLGATEDLTQSQGHPPSYYLNQNPAGNTGLPGSFPQSQSESIGQHKDGKQYVSPTGTHVGGTQTTQQSAQHEPLGQSTERGLASDVPPHHTDSKTAGAATAAGVGGAAIASQETKTGPNKLHKKEDPRGHVAFNEPPSHQAIHGDQPTTTTGTTGSTGTTGTTDTTTAVHHSIGGTHHSTAQAQSGDVYEQQAARKYDGNDALSGNTTNYSYPTSTAAATGAAVGAGGLAATQIPERKHHDDYSKTESNNLTSHSPPRGVGVYNTVTGAGSQDDPTHPHGSSTLGSSTLGSSTRDQTFNSHPGLTSGSSAVPREAGYSNISSGYGNTTSTSSNAPLPATLTGAGLGSNTTSDHKNTGASYTIPGPTTGSSNTTGGGEQHLGPGHLGSRVVHTCTKCGEDNDITHYFKKDSVYRLSQ